MARGVQYAGVVFAVLFQSAVSLRLAKRTARRLDS